MKSLNYIPTHPLFQAFFQAWKKYLLFLQYCFYDVPPLLTDCWLCFKVDRTRVTSPPCSSELFFGSRSKHFFVFSILKGENFSPKWPIIIGHTTVCFLFFSRFGTWNLRCWDELLRNDNNYSHKESSKLMALSICAARCTKQRGVFRMKFISSIHHGR